MERESSLGWTNNVQIFPMLVNVSEIPILLQSLTRKADQLATPRNSLVEMKKPAGYPEKSLESDSLSRLRREEFKPAGSW